MVEDSVSARGAACETARPADSAAIHYSPEDVFEQRLLELVQPGDRVLDVGCGAGKFFRADFATRIPCRWIGVDIQPQIRRNERLHLRARGDSMQMPFADCSFDVVICRWMIEHVADPAVALTHFARVLKASGRLALFTPNLLHYYGAAASLTPHWFHLWFNRRVRGFDEDDIFRTFYRANTRRRLRSLLADAGFSRIEITLVEGAPSALEFNPLLYGAGRIYESLVGRFDCLSAFRMNLIAVACKPRECEAVRISGIRVPFSEPPSRNSGLRSPSGL
jgi:ubiquinone/menaquinone biosynthesis C-methylase UbiE